MRYLYLRSFRVALIVILLLVIFFFARPYAAGWFAAPQPPQTTIHEDMVAIEQADRISIVQGKSEQAFKVINKANVPVFFNLGYAHGHLFLEPLSGTLAPGAARDITVSVDDLSPLGDINTMVYLKAEAEGESLGMETYHLLLNIIPGDLKLEMQDGYMTATWNDEPAPEGVMLYYRDTEDEEERWRELGEIPYTLPPANIRPGNYLLEFIATYGEIESEIVIVEVVVEEDTNSQTGARSSVSSSTASSSTAPGSTRTPRVEPEPPIHSQTGNGGMQHTIYQMEVP